MKRILYRAILAQLLAGLLVCTSAHAVTRWSYNPSTYSPIRVLSEWLVSGKGFNVRSTVTYSRNAQGCLVVIVTQYAGPFVTGQTVTEFPCR